MNAAELPMITFTLLAQMSAGAFVVLGVIHLVAALHPRYSTADADALSDPALLAVGASLVLGLVASMFHMHDVFHVLNVFRHLSSSWLSREIVMGMLFAGAGFCYTACQLMRWGSSLFRQVLAVVTAALGVALVGVMSMIYMSLVTVPAWHTWLTAARFGVTSLLLGAFAVGTALAAVAVLRRRRGLRRPEGNRPSGGGRSLVDDVLGAELTPGADRLMLASLRGIAVAGILLLAAEFVIHVLTVGRLAGLGDIGARSLRAYVDAPAVAGVVLTVVGAGLLGLFLFRVAGPRGGGVAERDGGGDAGVVELVRTRRLAFVVTSAFVLVFVAEFIARAAFYESNVRIGM